jgi:acyl-CoA reductase-like NAD-dependent aldehyde dehydrogenase
MSLTVLNPATEEPVAELDEAGVEDADAAVRAAREAFPAWAAVPPPHRARMLRELAGLVEQHAEELALLETRNVGKPISDSRGEVAMVAEVFHFYAGAVDKHHGETIPVTGGVDMTFCEPLGVVGLIVPWNFPIAISSWKLGPALACGNTVVLKPAELTPLTALRLEKLALEAGLPEGVVNVVVGPGSVVGRRLVEHPDVAKIGFTGSTEVGRGVMAGAAATIKRVTLELGGKSANVVLAPEGNGFWFPCTLVEASNDDRVAREEVFGPVAAVIPFEDERDAIRIANDTPYGLSGSIWTENGTRALRVARALETGVLSVNSNTSVRVSTPFGGFKQSGFGRELGMHALDGYSEVKNLDVATGE